MGWFPNLANWVTMQFGLARSPRMERPEIRGSSRSFPFRGRYKATMSVEIASQLAQLSGSRSIQ
jgi:hypothetical protein